MKLVNCRFTNAIPSDLSHSTSLRRIPMLYSFIDSWIKTTGACRYSDGYLFNVFASVKVTSHNACKDLCIQHLNKCDAFDTDGDECFLFNDKDGKKHTGNGRGADFCYVRDLRSSVAPVVTCGEGWTLLNGKCARRFGLDLKDRKNWQQAELDCVSKGGHLASVADVKELKALAQFCFRGLQPDWTIDCAVGLRRAKDGAFVWTDGQPFNSELEKAPHMSGHRRDHMHIEGHHFDMLEGDYNGGRGPFLYVCGACLVLRCALLRLCTFNHSQMHLAGEVLTYFTA